MVSIQISDLTHEFDDRIVFSAIDFAFDGGCMSITGPNGSGKSTLVRVLAGLLTPTDGGVVISLDGTPVPRDSTRGIIGLVAPDVRLYGELTTRENLQFLANARACKVSAGRIDEVMEEVGIAARADDPIRALSSGLRQRACFAAALLHRPPLLFLDEPSSNLDADGIRMTREVIARQSESGMVVIATNDADEAALGAARIDLGVKR